MNKDEILTSQSEEGNFSTKQAILFEFTSALRENSNSAWISKPFIWASKSTIKYGSMCPYCVALFQDFQPTLI